MPILLSKGALAIAAVVAIALNARGRPIRSKTLAMRLALPERHLEPVLQAMARHGILKSIRGRSAATSLRASNAASRPMRYCAPPARPTKRTECRSLSLGCSTAS
jgi:hypothetical protein